MYQKNSGFIPNDPNNSNYMRNPNGTLPFPRPSGMPVGFWDGGITPVLVQTPAGSSDNWREGAWRSPIFDLRPDLRAMTGGDNKGVPIWSRGQLFTLIKGLKDPVNSSVGLVVTVREFCSPNRVDNILQVTDPVDVSESFLSIERNCTTLDFYPLKSSSPIRFWQVEMKFEWKEPLGSTPVLFVFSSYY